VLTVGKVHMSFADEAPMTESFTDSEPVISNLAGAVSLFQLFPVQW
jgi:hypothetical protein